MPSIRLIGALFLSLAFVGGALWFRFIKVPIYSAPLVAVTEVAQFSSDDAYLKDFLGATTSKPAVSTATLSETDLLSRQLFTEYIGLKSKGQVTPNSINALADKYADSIVNLDLSLNIKKISLNQVVVLPDSEANLADYGSTITNIRSKYKNLVATQNTGNDITNIGGPAFTSFMSATAKLYQAFANELLLVAVPLSLAGNHVDLINNYLENAEIMKLISQASKDPVQAYAGLNIYVQNTQKESKLFLNIQTTLMANGIIFNSTI